MTQLLPGALAAFILSVLLVRILAAPAFARYVLDLPNERSLHASATPRTGGVGLLIAAGLTSALLSTGEMGTVTAFAAVLAAVFVIEDLRGLVVPVRFATQFLAATAFVVVTAPYPAWLQPCLIAGMIWCMNLYNFMDGANGLAGGMTTIGFATYAIAASSAGDASLATTSAIISGAAAGFLIWNFNRARIFLGDAGAIPIGFLAGAIGVIGWRRGVWPFWLPPLVFSPFIVDASTTLIRRALNGEGLLQAHKTHYFQKLIRMGWSHRETALAEYVVMLAAGGSSLLAREAGPLVVCGLISAWLAVYLVLAVVIDRRWTAFEAQASAGAPG